MTSHAQVDVFHKTQPRANITSVDARLEVYTAKRMTLAQYQQLLVGIRESLESAYVATDRPPFASSIRLADIRDPSIQYVKVEIHFGNESYDALNEYVARIRQALIAPTQFRQIATAPYRSQLLAE